MIKVGFTSSVEEPRLSHIRKTIMSARIYDKYLEKGNIKLAYVGDERMSFEAMLEDLGAASTLEQKMLNEGRYVFGFKHPYENIHHMIAIEKFELRRGIFGAKHGYWAEISTVEQTEEGQEPKYTFSSSLSDLGTKLFALFVQNAEVQLFTKAEASNNLMQS